eukprot:m.157639 g.157639  ORF g.157639 m.157639 type:complete len:718 (-) comp15121_c3_seq3:65-2218(-)
MSVCAMLASLHLAVSSNAEHRARMVSTLEITSSNNNNTITMIIYMTTITVACIAMLIMLCASKKKTKTEPPSNDNMKDTHNYSELTKEPQRNASKTSIQSKKTNNNDNKVAEKDASDDESQYRNPPPRKSKKNKKSKREKEKAKEEDSDYYEEYADKKERKRVASTTSNRTTNNASAASPAPAYLQAETINEEEMPVYEESMATVFQDGPVSESDYVTRQLVRQHEILDNLRTSKSFVTIMEKLGQGVGGAVHRATFKNKTVAVKQLLVYSEVAIKEFIQEAAIMGSFSDPDPHPHIVKIIGVCDQDKPHLLIMEYMKHGDLAHYLYDKRVNNKESLSTVGVDFIYKMGSHVANALSYLETVGCVHRDVAARNVLLSNDMVAKITDFGLSREVYHELYYEQKSARQLPVRWMAYETLTVGKSSIKSDVWAYGVFLWELATLADTPYPNLAGGREIVEYLDKGMRLKQPEGCPNDLYNLMSTCWLTAARERPTFHELDEQLKGILGSALPPLQPEKAYLKGHEGMPNYTNVNPPQQEPGSPVPRQSTGGSVSTPTSPLPPRNISNTPAPPEQPYWMRGAISRQEAEALLEEWGGEHGLFLIRESGSTWVMSRVGISDEGVSIHVHRKISTNDGKFMLQSTRTAAMEFNSLMEMIAYHQKTPFSDTTRLTSTVPKAVQRQTGQRYVNVAMVPEDQSGNVGMDHNYENINKKPYVNLPAY